MDTFEESDPVVKQPIQDPADSKPTHGSKQALDLEPSVVSNKPRDWAQNLDVARLIRQAIFTWWGVLVGLWLLLRFARSISGLLIQLLLALFISFALEPLVDRLEEAGIRRSLGTSLSLLGLLLGTFGFLLVIGELVATQLTELVDELPGYVRSGQTWLDTQFGLEIETEDFISQFQDGGTASKLAGNVADRLLTTGTTVASVLFQILTILLFVYYFTADGPRLRRTICSALPPARQHEVLRIWELAISKTGAYISSRFILGTASAVVHWVAFSILDLPSPVALALWVGLVSQFIPTLGTYLAGVLPALVALGVQPSKALWVLAVIVVYQQIENYILQPRVTAQTLEMHPAVSIAAVLAGTSLLGPTGALLALPIVATAQGVIGAYVQRHDVVESKLIREEPAANSG